jgi:hypothetical protein
MSNEIKEALKELGRVALLAVLPVIISSIESNNFDYKLILVVAGVAVLRALDKYLHLQAPDGVSGGLTRF